MFAIVPYVQVWVPPVAAIDIPSFAQFPWLGLVGWLVLLVLVLVLVGVIHWVRDTVDALEMVDEDWWVLVFGGTCGALLAGAMAVGWWALPGAAALLSAELFLFARRRDRLVPETKRFLGPGGMKNIAAECRTQWTRAFVGSQPPAAPESLKDRFRSLGTLLRRSATKPSKSDTRSKPATPKAAEPDGTFTFLKKDGTPAIVIQPGGQARVSDNVRSAHLMLANAMRRGATDLHFDPHDKQYAVRLRVDGVLIDADPVPQEVARGVISAIKVISDMNIAERRRPQDGTFAVLNGDDKYDIRVASTPTSYGEKLVLRLLQTSGGILSSGLDAIGLRRKLLEPLREIIHRPYGMFLVAGPTGSGKTTTVYAALSEIDAKQHNITTIEDPVEYRLENITQIAVNKQADVSFASILRSVLRQDPDVLLIGEIRDRETAEIACQAALTGHFVFSTLHANDSVATITRLLDLGLDATLLQSAITAVLGQRLARRLCLECREPCPPPPGLIKKFNLKPGVVDHIYKEKGCDACGGTGFRGRLGIHELLTVNDDIRGLMTEQPSINDLKAAAVKNGTHTLQIDGLMKVIEGVTSVSEVLRVTT